jgi:hypothetical protein
MHGFHVVDGGRHAVVLTVRRWDVPPEITYESIQYNGTCEAHYQGFREVDLQDSSSGTTVLFDWDGHPISLNESTYTQRTTADVMCRRGWDLLHINAVDKCPDGDYLISARHTDAIYKVSHRTGEIVWRLGGKFSDFQLGPQAKFSRQHDVRCIDQNDTHMTVSLFDNAVGEHYQKPTRKASRGLLLSLDLLKMTASVEAQYQHPRGQLTDGRGSFQILSNGNAFLNWAESSRISEHLPDGTVAMQASLKAGIDTYRAFKSPWNGYPTTNPDISSELEFLEKKKKRVIKTRISLSWNGATDYTSWNIRATDGDGELVNVADAVPRTGFETTVEYPGWLEEVYAEALDESGRVLGVTNAKITTKKTGSGSNFISGLWTGIATGLFVAALGLTVYLSYRYIQKRRSSSPETKGQYEMLKQEEEPTTEP